MAIRPHLRPWLVCLLLPLAVAPALPAHAPEEEAKAEVRGTVLDAAGQPVAGARVVRADGRQRVEGTTDADGRFRLTAAGSAPGFLFVEKAGFRFHGQRCDRPGSLKITLARRTEPAGKPMRTLPPALSRAERKAVAARLLEPYFRTVLDKGSDDDRLRPLEILARLDAGKVLEQLEKRPYKEAWYDSYLRRAAAKELLADSPEEARAVVDSMKDPGFRCAGYLDLCDALPADKRADKVALLNEALLHSGSIKQNDHRVIDLGWIARRLWELGEKERAAKLLRQGQAIAKELPTAGWAGYARGAFAEELALIDLPAALELMKDLKDNFEYVRHHGNLAHKLAGTQPAEAERVFDLLLRLKDGQQVYNRDHYAVRVCYRMAPADLPRARKIAATVKEPYDRARTSGVMAQALARGRPKEALELLDESFALLATQAASGQDHFNNYYDATVVAGLLLPAAEAIDPALVPEFFWRTVALHAAAAASGANRDRDMAARSVGALALVLARYDHDLALSLAEDAARAEQPETYGEPDHLLAAALADPRRAAALVEKLPDGKRKEFFRERVAGLLLRDGEALWQRVHSALGLWHIDDEDV
jgi:hypothetical protein